MVPGPIPAALRRYLAEVARWLPAAVVCRKYLIVVPRPLPEKPFPVDYRLLGIPVTEIPDSIFSDGEKHFYVSF